MMGLINVFRGMFGALIGQIAALQAQVRSGFQQEQLHMAEIDDRIARLQQDVAHNGDAVQSAVHVLSQVQQEIKDGIAAGLAAGATADQLAALSALDASLSQQSQALADAIAQSTPAAPDGGTGSPTPPAPSPDAPA